VDKTFEQWGEELNAIYTRGEDPSERAEADADWERLMTQMTAQFPHTTTTWMDPKCGCCRLDEPALITFDDPRGPDWFELLYPTFKPTQVHYFT